MEDSEYSYKDPGTIDPPGPIGRLMRLVLGVVFLWVVYRPCFEVDVRGLRHPSLWFAVLIGTLLSRDSGSVGSLGSGLARGEMKGATITSVKSTDFAWSGRAPLVL